MYSAWNDWFYANFFFDKIDTISVHSLNREQFIPFSFKNVPFKSSLLFFSSHISDFKDFSPYIPLGYITYHHKLVGLAKRFFFCFVSSHFWKLEFWSPSLPGTVSLDDGETVGELPLRKDTDNIVKVQLSPITSWWCWNQIS